MRRTITSLIFMLALASVALSQGKPSVNTETKDPTAPLVVSLTKEESAAFDQFKLQDEKNNATESKTVDILDKVAEDNDAALLLAARLLKGTIENRKKLQTEYRAWLVQVQKAHDCDTCRVSPDGKSLIKVPVEKK